MIEKINMRTATEKVEEDMMMMAAEELEEEMMMTTENVGVK